MNHIMKTINTLTFVEPSLPNNNHSCNDNDNYRRTKCPKDLEIDKREEIEKNKQNNVLFKIKLYKRNVVDVFLSFFEDKA